MASSFIVEQLSFLFIAKILNVTKGYSREDFALQDKCINISLVVIIKASIEEVLLTLLLTLNFFCLLRFLENTIQNNF